jgi:hypothetical protein
VRSSPFVDFVVGGAAFQQRFAHLLIMGAEVGAYLWDLVRVAPQLSIITSKPDDRVESDELPNGFIGTPSDAPTILWGGSIGVTLLSRETFALAPGVMFLRTDEAAYGNFLGVNVPLDWVTSTGARIGFVVAVGRGFGGSVRGTCPTVSFGPSPNAPDCDPGEIREFNRTSAAAFYSHFHIGWGAGHPEPIKPQ